GCAAAGAAGRARLLLADAVGYGVHKYRPSRVVTVGCLSPDTAVALGDRTGAVVTRSRGQAQRVTRRAARAGERWWPLPVPTYLDAATASPTADVSLCPEGPGVLVAAAVLRRFAGDTPAVHLDLGGAATSRECREDTDPLGTGFGARSLVEWLR
ncbi:peptidase M17, partial [Corynebacterium bovis]